MFGENKPDPTYSAYYAGILRNKIAISMRQRNRSQPIRLVKVRCLGKQHRILLHKGRLRLADHDVETDRGILVAQVLEPTLACRCHEVLGWWKLACLAEEPSRWRAEKKNPWIAGSAIKTWTNSGFLGMLPSSLRDPARENRGVSRGRLDWNENLMADKIADRAEKKEGFAMSSWGRRTKFAEKTRTRTKQILMRGDERGGAGWDLAHSRAKDLFNPERNTQGEYLSTHLDWLKALRTPWGKAMISVNVVPQEIPPRTAWKVNGVPVDFPPMAKVLVVKRRYPNSADRTCYPAVAWVSLGIEDGEIRVTRN